MWFRLFAIAPLKSLDIDNRNTLYRQYWETCVGCQYIAVLFPAGKYRGTIDRGTIATVSHTSRHSTTQGHNSNAQPNFGPTGPRLHDGCQPGTLCGHRELCSDTLVARVSSLSCYACCFKTILILSITCTAILYVLQCTT